MVNLNDFIHNFNILQFLSILVVIVLSLATFLLPTNAGEKILLNLATTVIILITLYFISNRLPAIAYTPPLIGNLFCRFSELK
jgi:low affinity Fe/Cu permease